MNHQNMFKAPNDEKSRKRRKTFFQKLAKKHYPADTEMPSKNGKLSFAQRVFALFCLIAIPALAFALLDYYGKADRAFEGVKKLKSENDILSDKLNTQENSPSKSEDLMQKIENKEDELRKAFENKLAEDFKKPNLVSAGEHLEDIELGNYKIIFREENNNSGQDNWKMEVLNGNKIIKAVGTSSSRFSSNPIWVNNGDTSLFLFQRFTGGAHCCFLLSPAVYSHQILRFGNELDLSHYEISGDKNLFEKDGQLYLYILDPQFAYFYSGFANSGIMWYPSFYHFDSRTAQLVPVNNEFKDYYQTLYEGMNDEINKWLEGGKQSVYSDWLPWLTARSVNGLLAGNSEKDIWKEFNDDFNYFVKYHKPEDLKDKTADQVKKEILEKLKL